jgi:hypothetical protein
MLVALKAIAVATIGTGAIQIAAPQLVLGVISVASGTSLGEYLFAIVGMFMVLFGGLLLHALSGPELQRVPLLWAGLQKLGASIAVALGVAAGVLVPLALLVAAFDLASAVLALIVLHRTRHPQLSLLAAR